jgi:hypothetical protein
MVQQHLFNLRRLMKLGLSLETLTNYHVLVRNCTTHNHKALQKVVRLHNASPGENYLPSRTITAPDVTGRPKISSRTTIARATACSPRYQARSAQVRQSWD